MKKFFIFAIALVAGVMSMNAQTALDTTQVDGIWYILDKTNHTATVTYGPGETGGIGQDTYSGRLIIPESFWAGSGEDYADYTVTAIGDNAFAWCNNLTGITIPKTVRTLGLNLLQRSGNVTELKIEDGDEPIYFRYNQGDTGEEISFQELAYSCSYLYLGRNVEVLSNLEWTSPVFHTWSEVKNVVLGEKFTEVPLAFCPYARNLQTIQLNMSSVLTPGTRMFAFLEEDTPQPDASAITLYVPQGMLEAYQADAYWSRFTIEEMDKEQQYGIKYAESTFHFRKDGLFYQIQEDQYNHKRLAVVIPQVWYLNPDGSYVSQWSAEYPYTESSIIIPDSVTYWKSDEGIYSRYSGTPVTGWDKYTWPVEIIGDYCFRNAKNLESVTIPSTVYRIGTEVFEYTDKLHSLTIPESIKEVGWLAFARTGLKEVVIPASSSNWLDSDAAFQDNANLTKVTFAQGTTAIQDRIFFGCVALRTIIIPDEVMYIGPGAFAGCEALTEIHLPASLQVLNNRLFRGCPLRSLEIPAGVIEIEGSALLGTNIAKLTVNPANTVFDSRDNCNAIIRTANNTIVAATAGAFIPATVDSIEQESFNELYGIRSITLPANLKHVADYGFMNLTNLTLITSLIENPAGVLEEGAFENWYNDPHETATLYVPAGTLAAYRADEQWNRFQNIVEMTPETKPASVEDIAPIAESGTASMADLPANTDLTNAVVGNLYLTCDTTNGDHYDAMEQALVLNTVVDEVMIENVLANPDNMDVIRNNFSGIILTIPAGTGTLSLTIQTSGNHEVAVRIEGQEAETFAQAAKGLIEIPYSVEGDAYVFVYGVVAEEQEAPASAPSKFRARAKRTEAAENSVSIYDVQWEVSSATGVENVRSDQKPSTKVLRNGLLLIEQNGKTYNVLGTEMK
ncbi:MAG: leucine-rich repeat protein [Paludibacteraceae bacterium]|nr:leucine-rich repeat protein [Paludibacteraceae bacterium]